MLILFLLFVGIVGGIVWDSYSRQRVDYAHHNHGAESHGHEHVHSHVDGADHGHRHPARPFATPHSHYHRHDRHEHDDIELPGQEGLTEIGHSHGADQTTRFWAKVAAEDGEFLLEFFQSVGSELNPAVPTETTLTAAIFNGGELEEVGEFEKSDGIFVAPQPEGFHWLPTHIIKIDSVQFANHKLAVSIPLSQGRETCDRASLGQPQVRGRLGPRPCEHSQKRASHRLVSMLIGKF